MSDPTLDLFAAVAEEETLEAPLEGPAHEGEETGPRVWTVSDVNRAVRALLEETIPPLWVSGEVANWTRARSGHRYFTLKDESAQLRCVMWRGDADRLPTDPEEGMEVRAFGALTLYEARGEYQLVVRSLEAMGAEGLWRLAFERLRSKLDAEGLLAPERKRPIPRHPARVGVVTSATGAALRDILTVIQRRAPWTEVILRGTRVQGEGAAAEVAAALRTLAGSGLCDVVIVGRGGGSIEDLWAFNEEVVARAIAASPVPVVSAVGHEVDVTIADLVADLRAPTPSAAAEAAVPDGIELLRQLRLLPTRLGRALMGVHEGRVRGLRLGVERLRAAIFEDTIAPRVERVRRLREELGRGVKGAIREVRHHEARIVGRLRALSPLSVLGRGYAIPLGAAGQVLGSITDFAPDTEFTLRVRDGHVEASARRARPEELPDLAWALATDRGAAPGSAADAPTSDIAAEPGTPTGPEEGADD